MTCVEVSSARTRDRGKGRWDSGRACNMGEQGGTGCKGRGVWREQHLVGKGADWGWVHTASCKHARGFTQF